MADNPFKILYFRKKKHFFNFQRTFCCYLDCGTSHHRNMSDEEKTEMYVHVYL